MSKIQKRALVILGAPHSGLSLLVDCLGLLGLASNCINREDTGINSPGSINRLLLQELQCAPMGVGSLPEGWQQTEAAAKAQARIGALLAESAESPLPCLIADSVVCRVLPLWLEVFQELNTEPCFIHIVRHPWEAANSLMQSEGLDLFKGHLLWLASHREAFSGSSGYSCTVITFDQLLSDPVSTLLTIGKALAIEYSLNMHSAYHSLIDHVQPGLKNYHAGHASEEDKQQFALFNRIYDGLRVIQSYAELYPDRSRSARTRTPVDTSPDKAWTRLGLSPPTNTSETVSSTELIDLLFKVIGIQEQKARTLDSQEAGLTHSAPGEQPLMAKFYFPHADGATLTESISLPADTWRQVTLPVPRPDLLHNQPLRFSPLNCHGTALISALKLINRVTGEALWVAQTPQDFDALTFDGTVLRLPDLDNLVLLVTGNEALIHLPNVEKLPDCPVEFKVWLRVSRKQSPLHEVSFVRSILGGYLKSPPLELLKNYLKQYGDGFDEGLFVNSIIEESIGSSPKERFQLFRELGQRKVEQKDNLRALHYYTQARKMDVDEPRELFLFSRAYFNLGQKDLALQTYMDFSFKLMPIEDKIKDDFVKLLSSYQERLEVAKEHGQWLLIQYINDNLEFIRKGVDRRLNLIEIGSTREDVPGQGSTKKLAQLCQKHGIHFITVDMDPHNTKYAQNTLNEIDKSFEAITAKGEDFLKEYAGPVDFVFLDAYDFDHGKHSEERQSRYKTLLGARISDEDCHKMHLECASYIESKLLPNGAICLDDTWYKDGRWRGKGTKAVPYLLNKDYEVILSANRSVLLVKYKDSAPSPSMQPGKTSKGSETLQIHSVELEVNPADKGGLHYRGRQHVEESVSPIYRLIRERLSPEVVIDIGANYGFTASIFAKELMPKRLVAVEPDPNLLPFLELNIERNVPHGIEIQLLPCLVGAEERSKTTFGLNPNGSQDNRVHPEGNWPLCTVSERTLESILNQYGSGASAFIKVDTQGYDPIVVASGSKYLEGHDNWLIRSEFAPYWMRSQGLDPVESLMVFTKKYQVYEAPGRTPYFGDIRSIFSHPILPDLERVQEFVAYVESLNHGQKGWVDIFIMPYGSRIFST